MSKLEYDKFWNVVFMTLSVDEVVIINEELFCEIEISRSAEFLIVTVLM